MIVTVAGSIASGKTTLAKKLAQRLGHKHVSAGKIMRSMAEQAGMNVVEYSRYAQDHPQVDKEIDERQKKLASDGDCVIDGRISAYFIDADFKVFLTAPVEVRAKRLSGRDKTSNPEAEIREREASEVKRYKSLYNIDVTDLSVYDMILNTGKFDIEEMVYVVATAIEKLRF